MIQIPNGVKFSADATAAVIDGHLMIRDGSTEYKRNAPELPEFTTKAETLFKAIKALGEVTDAKIEKGALVLKSGRRRATVGLLAESFEPVQETPDGVKFEILPDLGNLARFALKTSYIPASCGISIIDGIGYATNDRVGAALPLNTHTFDGEILPSAVLEYLKACPESEVAVGDFWELRNGQEMVRFAKVTETVPEGGSSIGAKVKTLLQKRFKEPSWELPPEWSPEVQHVGKLASEPVSISRKRVYASGFESKIETPVQSTIRFDADVILLVTGIAERVRFDTQGIHSFRAGELSGVFVGRIDHADAR